MRWAVWVFDPLHRLPLTWRVAGYAWLAVFFARLALWYTLEANDA